jgi:hypothetical protein
MRMDLLNKDRAIFLVVALMLPKIKPKINGDTDAILFFCVSLHPISDFVYF